MNWYSESPANWSEKNSIHSDLSSSEALSLAHSSVTTLKFLLKTFPSSQSDFSDLSEKNQLEVNHCISDIFHCLNKLASSYNIQSPSPFPPLPLKPEVLSLPISEISNPFLNKALKPVQIQTDDSTIALGSVFFSLEEAGQAFKDYAARSGFTSCKGNSKKNVFQEFSCSARGKVRMRKVQDESRQRNRKSMKKMCKCHIILRKKHNFWILTTRKLIHSHELLSTEDLKKTAKNRFIPEDCKLKAFEMYEKGEAPVKIQLKFESLLKEKCSWSMKDLYNLLYKYKSR
jgi:hypothetical protein